MLDDAKKFWEALSGKVETACRQETRNAFRCGRYDVTTAPNGNTMGVTLPMGDTELFLPYSQEVASAQVGDAVLVVWWGSMSTARVCFFGDGYRGTSISGKTGSLTLNDIMAWSLSVGTYISRGSNLDTYTTPGTYYCQSASDAGTMTNGPWPSNAYKLVVMRLISSERLFQIGFPNNGATYGVAKVRFYNGSWTDWKTVGALTDTGTPAALGTAAVGINTSAARSDHVHPMPSASDVGAVADEVGTVSKSTFFSDTSAFPGTVSIKKQGNVIEFYGTFNATTKPTDGTHANAIASGFRAAAQYAILPMYSGSSPYLQVGTVWIYQGGTIAFYGTPNGLGYIHGTYICS